MKYLEKLAITGVLLLGTLVVQAQTKTNKIEKKEVEIACGECMFKLPGKGCDLAVRIDGIAYFVDGRSIHDFGDAHADNGFCNAIGKAVVTGEIVDNRFKAQSVQLVETKKAQKPKS